MSNDTHNILAIRRHEIEGEIALLRERLTALQQELDEIGTAERVLARYSGAQGGKARSGDQPAEATDSVGKPTGTPSVPTMIVEALTNAREQGKKGLETKDLVAFIRARYWRGAKTADIGSIAWRMKKRGQLRKSGDLHILSNTEAANRNSGREPFAASATHTQSPREAGAGGGT